ncbi:MAG: cytochrome P450 [Actinobacteria bacterium]|nr:cytochrome P450 [Acidobacteriota bacterium]MCA1701726.1 cytochrome P450 [Actinomycetota bacterium]
MIGLESLICLSFDARIRGFFDYLNDRRAVEAVGLSAQGNTWEVFRYDEAVEVLNDFHTFSSDVNAFIPPDEQQLARAANGHLAGIDPPRHTELRGLINRAFTPAVVTKLEPRIAAIAERLLDEAVARCGDQVTFDVIGDFAGPLTATMIGELFGIPDSDHAMFATWAATLLNTKPPGELGVADAEAMQKIGELLREVTEYLSQHIRARRAAPSYDLTSNLTVAEVDGKKLGDDEIIGVISMFLLAGFLPGSVLIGNTVMCLDEHPEVLAEVRQDLDLLPATINEVLRWRPPLVRDQRITTREAQLGGRTIPALSPVCVWLASANRDESHFDAPHEFDIHRNTGRHLALGKGIHYCLGGALSRLETRIALSALFQRFERIEVLREGGVEFHDSIGLLGPSRLSVIATGEIR